MATRFYLTWLTSGYPGGVGNGPAGIPEATPMADWDQITTFHGPTIHDMYPWRTGTGGVLLQSQSETSASALNMLIAQGVSPPLAAQTISGTMNGMIGARESSTSADMRAQLTAWVMKPDGTSRGTLLNADNGSLANEFTTSTTPAGARFPKGSTGTAISSVSCQAGDRIVVELGYRAHNTSTTSFTGTLGLSDYLQTDMSTTAGQAYTSNNTWIEFSANLTFDGFFSISDSIAGAPDIMPDSGEMSVAYVADMSTYTTESDDPTQLGVDTAAGVDFTGWVKLVGPTGGARIQLNFSSGYGVFPLLWVFDESPVASSVSILDAGYLDAGDTVTLDIPEGETRWVALMTSYGDAAPWDFDKHAAIHATRWPLAAPSGDIKDDLADVVDVFPASEGDEVTITATRLDLFTADADDPVTDWTTYMGSFSPGYSGWFRIDVPSGVESVSIRVVAPTTLEDTVMFLYDEVPTSSSVAIDIADDLGTGGTSNYWSAFSEKVLAAGTYYVAIVPYGLGDWVPIDDNFADIHGTQVSVLVRWERPPVASSFSTDAVLFKTILPPHTGVFPTVRDTSFATLSSGTSLTINVPGGAQVGDALIVYVASATAGSTADDPSAFPTIVGGTGTGWFYTNSNYDTTELRNLAVLAWDSPQPSNIEQSYKWLGSPTSLSLTWGQTVTAIAYMIAVTGPGAVPSLDRISRDFGDGTAHASNSISISALDANYGDASLALAAFVSDQAMTVYDSPFDLVTPVLIDDVDESGLYLHVQSMSASYIAYTAVAETVGATRTINDITTWLAARGQFSLYALVAHGGAFDLNAVIQALFHTTHPRTGPHYAQTPSDFITLSQALGTLSAGDTLTTALAELEAKIRELERGES